MRNVQNVNLNLPQHPFPDRAPEPYRCIWCFEATTAGDYKEGVAWDQETGQSYALRLHEQCHPKYYAWVQTLKPCRVCGKNVQLIDDRWCSEKCQDIADERVKDALKVGKMWLKKKEIPALNLENLRKLYSDLQWWQTGINANWLSRPPLDLKQGITIGMVKIEQAIHAEEAHIARQTATGTQMKFSKAVQAAAEAAKKREGLVDDYLKAHGVKYQP